MTPDDSFKPEFKVEGDEMFLHSHQKFGVAFEHADTSPAGKRRYWVPWDKVSDLSRWLNNQALMHEAEIAARLRR